MIKHGIIDYNKSKIYIFRLSVIEIKQRPLIPGKKILEDHPDVTIPEEALKRIDYILVYRHTEETGDDLTDDVRPKYGERKELRERFEEELLESGFAIQYEEIGDILEYWIKQEPNLKIQYTDGL